MIEVGAIEVVQQDQGVDYHAHLESAWTSIRTGLRRDVGARMFDQWLKPARLGAYCPESQTLDIQFASDFSANFVAGQFGDRLRMAWRCAEANVDEVRFVRAPEALGMRRLSQVPVANNDVQAPTPDQGPKCNFQPRHKFEEFVTGDSNQLAYSAAQVVAAGTQPRFNPLFIHGNTGQGKTHLLHAIADAFCDHLPDEQVLYMSAERFMVEFVNAIRANESMAFKARLRAAKLLMIDDIQFIAGKGSTQEEFLHTVNDLIDSGARIVVTADRAPQLLDGIDSRILSRLSGGLVADIQPATLELRQSILEAKRGQAGDLAVPDDVIDFLARSIRSSIRELEGAFNKLVAYGQLTNRIVDLEFAQSMFADAVRANTRRITVEEIQKVTAAHFRIDLSEMRSKRRSRSVARPRQVAMYLAKKMTPRSLPDIGRNFGGRDHTTVIHAIRTIEGLRESSPEMDSDVRALMRHLEG